MGFSGTTEAVVDHAIKLLGDAVIVTDNTHKNEASSECERFIRPDVNLPRLLDLMFYSNQVSGLLIFVHVCCMYVSRYVCMCVCVMYVCM